MKRYNQHIYSSRIPKDYFHRVIKKYGEDNFSVIILKEVFEDECIDELETQYIDWLKPHYNLKGGGDGGKHSQVSKDRMSENRKGKKPQYTEEGDRLRRERLSKSCMGKNTWSKNKKWWNNGIECKYQETQPEGYVRGRLQKHKRGLQQGLEVGTKLNLTEDEIKRRSEWMKKLRNTTIT